MNDTGVGFARTNVLQLLALLLLAALCPGLAPAAEAPREDILTTGADVQQAVTGISTRVFVDRLSALIASLNEEGE